MNREISIIIGGSSVKNNSDAIIFHTAICFGAKADSFYDR